MRDHYKLARLYVDTPLKPGARFALDRDQSRYLSRVLRKREGDEVRVFNAEDGEYLCTVYDVQSHIVTLGVGEQIRAPKPCLDIWMLFAPIKRERTRFIVEKATELGAAHILPVMTARTNGNVKMDKLCAHIVEAAEQTERLDLPLGYEPIALMQMLEDWDENRTLMFADEAGDAKPAQELMAFVKTPCAILIGPEGGFTDEERAMLRAKPFVRPISLGPRILRADTAAVSALTLWQAMSGDWK